MRVIIAGSRGITDYQTVYEAIKESRWAQDITAVVSGTSRSGWSDAALGGARGTVNNINETIYGSSWVWW